jgi:hypothetical protein
VFSAAFSGMILTRRIPSFPLIAGDLLSLEGYAFFYLRVSNFHTFLYYLQFYKLKFLNFYTKVKRDTDGSVADTGGFKNITSGEI